MVIISSSPWLAHPSRVLVPSIAFHPTPQCVQRAPIAANSDQSARDRSLQCTEKVSQARKKGARRETEQQRKLLCFFASASEVIKGELCVWVRALVASPSERQRYLSLTTNKRAQIHVRRCRCRRHRSTLFTQDQTERRKKKREAAKSAERSGRREPRNGRTHSRTPEEVNFGPRSRKRERKY